MGSIGACGATVPEVMYQRGLRPRVSGRPPSALWLSPQRVAVGCGVLAVSQRLPVRGTHRPWFLARTTTSCHVSLCVARKNRLKRWESSPYFSINLVALEEPYRGLRGHI